METWKWYVYIIECNDNTFYTGMTWKPDVRWIQHVLGSGSRYTGKRGAKRVVYLEEYENIDEARRRERQIKDWSQAKKKKLISGQWGKWA